MINRAALLLKYKEPAINWINDADPLHDNPGVSLESVNEERTVYLISEADSDGPEAVEKWVKLNWKNLFESELEGWYTDPDLWPEKLSLALFYKWVSVEFHTVLLDTVGGSIYDDGI